MRICLASVILYGLVSHSAGAPDKKFSVVFHNQHTVPSNLYLNSAVGERVTVQDNPEYDGKIFNLVLYPSDKKSKEDKLATAIIKNGAVKGVLRFRQAAPPMGPTHITGTITGLTPGLNYLTIHRLGNIESGCLDNRGVFDPYTIIADWRWRVDRSIGDIGSVVADEAGEAKVDILDRFVKLVGPRAVIGRMISIAHVQEDLQELREVGEENVGCGVIGFAN